MLFKDKSILENTPAALQLEWLETNGLGGWSSSTIIGCNTRRYHGLLVAALNSPTERFSLLAKLDEAIVVSGERFDLSMNEYAGEVFGPLSSECLAGFNRNIFPEWLFRAGGVELKKTIAMIHGENTVLIIYDLITSAQPIQLEFLPLVSARGYHQLQHASTNIWWDVDFHDGIFNNQPNQFSPQVYISIPNSTYKHHPQWYYRFEYTEEKSRGLDFEEDLFNHGKLFVGMKEGDSLGVIVSTGNPANRDAHALLAMESLRRQSLLVGCPDDETLKRLTLAADQFIVNRGAELKSIIAGYHWFTDWSRDTMISLPGLCLSTSRFDDAKKILKEFASLVNMGMLPNRFEDGGGLDYNQVDGTLWFFVAIYKYLKATDDKLFVLEDLLPTLRDILEWHAWGTRYNIKMDADGLLYAGEDGLQLTWMDAKVGDKVITPRIGKPVEVNALWYNAQKIFAELLAMNGEIEEAAAAEASAVRTRERFIEIFWNEEAGYCYDVIGEFDKDKTVRPNAIFSVGLPFSLFEDDKAKRILSLVRERLYTPPGLRSLEPADPRYSPVYDGNLQRRDSAYHQGTVWTWLMGPYVDAIMKFGGGADEARAVVESFKFHLQEAGLGSVSEIADAEFPFHPRGCIAQAWGVGEWLRVIKDYGLYENGPN